MLGCVTTDVAPGVSNLSQGTLATPVEVLPQHMSGCATTGGASASLPSLPPSRSCASGSASNGNSASTPEATLRHKTQAPDDPTTAAEAIECIRLAAVSKLRIAMKILRTTQLTHKQIVDVIGNLAQLITQEQKMTSTNCAKLINYLRMFAESTPDSVVISNALAQTSMRIALTRNVLVNPDRARAVKALLVYAATRLGAAAVISQWSRVILNSQTMDETMAQWVEEWSLKGEHKIEWERFFNMYGPKRQFRMESSSQSSQISISQDGAPKATVDTVIVWNGNGARARWSNKAELKQVVQSADPDVLCFLESKTDAEKLLRLPQFREWTASSQFRQINCYWSIKDDKTAFGCEGLILFSKVPCKVTYGMGIEDLDKQARVLTAEFSDCVMLFTYNPQGGFTEESQAFRKKWEIAISNYILQLRQAAIIGQKKMLWAGDLNVNPSRTDWSDRAFDRIRHKIPKGTQPIGCRAEDQEAYRVMLRGMDGINLAEHFAKQHVRTCFQSEEYMRKDYGQRIDHVIAEPGLLDKESALRVVAFDTLLQFGASRKGSSDHCPLWFKLERGHPQTATVASIVEQKLLVDDVTQEVQSLYQSATAKYNDVEPTPEFQEADPSNLSADEECIENQWEDFACSAEIESDFKQRPFEDCSSPIIHCCVRGRTSADKIPVKVLVDSGSTLDLISGKMARKLKQLGHSTHNVEKGIKIKVANGRRSVLTEAMPLQLLVQEQHTEPIDWLVLEDLPFDMILGSETCKKWKSIVDWKNSTFTMTPGEGEIKVDWNVYRGQHWRKPAVLTTVKSTTIPANSQIIVEVHNSFNIAEGYSCKAGIVTPTREEAITSQQFSVAYMYGENIDRVVVANTSSVDIAIAAGTPIAEFHARTTESLEFKPQDEVGNEDVISSLACRIEGAVTTEGGGVPLFSNCSTTTEASGGQSPSLVINQPLEQAAGNPFLWQCNVANNHWSKRRAIPSFGSVMLRTKQTQDQALTWSQTPRNGARLLGRMLNMAEPNPFVQQVRSINLPWV
jgi:exodeoxyribonuclease III